MSIQHLTFVMLLLGIAPCVSGQGLVWEPLGEPGPGGQMTALSVSPHDGQRVLVSGDMLGMGLSLDAGRSWNSTFGLPAYEMADVTWHPTKPQVVWVASMSGPLVSLNGGVKWEWRRQGMGPAERSRFSSPIEKILFDPNNTERLIAVGGSSRDWNRGRHQATMGRVWESNDGGLNWEELGALTPAGSIPPGSGGTGINITAAAFGGGSSDVLYAAALTEGVFVSRDGGRTWSEANQGLPHRGTIRLHAHPDTPSTAWVALVSSPEKSTEGTYLPGGIYKTTDYGQTWRPINNGLPQKGGDHPRANTSWYHGFAVSPSNPDHMVTFDCSYEQGVAYVTTDGGRQWYPTATRSNNGDTAHVIELEKKAGSAGHRIQVLNTEIAYYAGMGLKVVTFDPNDEKRVYACGTEYILYSEDGGFTWANVSNDLVGETEYGRAYRSRGYGGLVASDFAFDPQTPGVAIAQGLDAGRVWLSRDDLHSWTYHARDRKPWDGGYGVAFGAQRQVYTGIGQHGFHGFARSLDGAKTWEVLHGKTYGLPERNDDGEMEVTDLFVDLEDSDMVWMIAGRELLKSSDAGGSWTQVSGLAELGYAEHDPTNPGYVYISSKRGVFYGDGDDFELIPGPRNAGRVAVDAGGRLYVAAGERTGNDRGLWRFDREANTWTLLHDSPVAVDVDIDPFDGRRLVMTTGDVPAWDINRGDGVWVSDDAGGSWALANEGLAMRRGVVVVFDPHRRGRLVLGTRGRGFFVGEWPEGWMPDGKRHQAAAGSLPWLKTDSGSQGIAPTARTDGKSGGTFANGDMSQTDQGRLRHWEITWSDGGDVVVLQDIDEFQSDPASMRIDLATDGTKCLVGQWIDDLPKGSRLSGLVKSRGSVKVSVTARSVDTNNRVLSKKQIKYVGADQDWTAFDGEVMSGDQGERYFAGVYVEGQGSVWLDNFALVLPEAMAE